MKYNQALDALLAEKPIRRAFWPDGLHFRFSELWDTFSIAEGTEVKENNSVIWLTASDLFAEDWMIGKYNPVTGEPIWEETK
jgi:hypothetical protein